MDLGDTGSTAGERGYCGLLWVLCTHRNAAGYWWGTVGYCRVLPYTSMYCCVLRLLQVAG